MDLDAFAGGVVRDLVDRDLGYRERDHRRVVRAGEDEGYVLHRAAAVAVVEGQVVALPQGLARAEVLDLGVGNLERPVEPTGAVAGGVVAYRRAERAEVAGATH